MSEATHDIVELLRGAGAEGDFPVALVCTDQGLLVAASAEHQLLDDLAALTTLADDVIRRAERDTAMGAVDEVTLRSREAHRVVVRPLDAGPEVRLFLVCEVPRGRSWRRITNRLCRDLDASLAGIGPAL
ncbi:MAG: hypothetical protein H6742_09410 [Alphaproteobacteria bacterium]|nr:hypothetical protein [Alphaproteobacteria bacterium]